MEHYPDPVEPMAVVSSSPLKTATSVSGALSAYLHKYVEVATGNRVAFQGMHSFALGGNGWFRFKCKTCQDNWNMKTDLFTNQTSCPKELTDWLELHKHVCSTFSASSPTSWIGNQNPKCFNCGWAWNQHKAGMPIFDIENNVWLAKGPPMAESPDKIIIVERDGSTTGVRGCGVCGETIAVASGSSICDECYKVAKAARSMKSVQTTQGQGRMFRTKEGTCESPNPINQTNLIDSANSTTSASKD